MKLTLGLGLLGLLLLAAPAQASCSNILNSSVCLDDYSDEGYTYYSFGYGVADSTVAGYGYAYTDDEGRLQVEGWTSSPGSTDTWVYSSQQDLWTGVYTPDHGASVHWYDGDDDGLVDVDEVSFSLY